MCLKQETVPIRYVATVEVDMFLSNNNRFKLNVFETGNCADMIRGDC